MNLFSTRLKALRCEKGLTLQQVADYLSVNKATISFYEKGKRTPCFDRLLKLANLFNVSIDYLLGHDHLMKEEKEEYSSKDLVVKSVARNKVLKDFLLKDPNNIKVLEDYIKSLKP